MAVEGLVAIGPVPRGPGEIIRTPVVGPAIATLFGWYWMAFVAGGISLAGGCSLALRSRDHDRQARRAD
jgi:hypothetical protein